MTEPVPTLRELVIRLLQLGDPDEPVELLLPPDGRAVYLSGLDVGADGDWQTITWMGPKEVRHDEHEDGEGHRPESR
jgi:hypothetical protein